jgi:hypothetical protein
MAGDKQLSVPQGRSGARGSRRTRESMRAAGVTDAGIALVEAVADLIDEHWPNRQALVDALGKPGAQAGLDRKRLSKELGSKDKPKGPEWHITALIVTVCGSDPGVRKQALARLAGLYCAARGVERPPGYQDAISWPAGSGRGNEGSVAMREVIDRLQRELNHKIASLAELRSLNDGTFQKLAEQQLHLDLQRGKVRGAQDQAAAAQQLAEARAQQNDALLEQVAAFSTQLQLKDAELDRTLAREQARAAELAAKEEENSRLSQEVMRQSAQVVQVRAELEEARRTIAVQQRGLHDTNSRLAEHDLHTAAALQRHDNLRERCARLAAQLEGMQESLSMFDIGREERPDGLALTIDGHACRCLRALSAYLLIHQEYSGRSVAQLATTLNLASGHLQHLLTGRAAPDPAGLAAIVHAIGAEITHARLLYDDVAACCRPGSAATDADDRFRLRRPAPSWRDIGSYESIVGSYNRDNIDFAASREPLPLARVTLSLSDSDIASATGDTGDTNREARSPATGDMTVADQDGDLLSPLLMTRHRSTAVYRSRSHQYRLRRHRRTVLVVTAVGALIIPLLFTLAVAAGMRQSVSIAVVYLSTVGACLTCWGLAIMTRVALRRSRYRARHSPKTRAGIIAGLGTPPSTTLDTTPAEPVADPVADPEATQTLRPVIAQESPSNEPDLQIRAQQLAQALSGRQGLGIQRRPARAAAAARPVTAQPAAPAVSDTLAGRAAEDRPIVALVDAENELAAADDDQSGEAIDCQCADIAGPHQHPRPPSL